MSLTRPQDVTAPRDQIKNIRVLYDGTVHPHQEFSIAELELDNGEKVIGVRHDRDVWASSVESEEKGYPKAFGKHPTWFILPEINTFLPELIRVLLSR